MLRFVVRSCSSSLFFAPSPSILPHSTSRCQLRLQSRAAMSTQTDTFFMDGFALRQFQDPNYTGTQIRDISPEAFTQKINEQASLDDLKEGYAPFCKHVFVPNFIGATCPVVEINDDTAPLIQSTYKARTPKELPVLVRWVPKEKYAAKEAKWLDVILYSREQIVEEHAAMGDDDTVVPDSPWGIISIKAQDEPYETPMQPITMMRNALGKDEGGSGVKLDREKYDESVKYWKTHVPLA